MKELTINEVKEVSGGFRGNGFSQAGRLPKIDLDNPIINGILWLGNLAIGTMVVDAVKKINEDPAAYGRGLTTWPHYFGKGRPF